MEDSDSNKLRGTTVKKNIFATENLKQLQFSGVNYAWRSLKNLTKYVVTLHFLC
jgi:hypothetical protein